MDVHVNATKIKCLVDTGSQVTLFTQSLCNELFDAPQLQEAKVPWLTLQGTNGLTIPYMGYVVVDFQVRGITVPGKGVVIVQDHCLGAHRALLSMNVISACWEELFRTQPSLTPRRMGARELDAILADCQRIYASRAQWDHEDTGRVACL